MHEDPLERHGLGQTYEPMLLGEPERLQCGTQQRGVGQVGMVVRKGAKLDHGMMVPQGIRSGQR